MCTGRSKKQLSCKALFAALEILISNACVTHTLVFFCLFQSQLGITEVELKDLICERERKVEEIQNSLQDIKVSFQSLPRLLTFQVQSWFKTVHTFDLITKLFPQIILILITTMLEGCWHANIY